MVPIPAHEVKKKEHEMTLKDSMVMARTSMIFRHFAFGSASPAPIRISEDDEEDEEDPSKGKELDPKRIEYKAGEGGIEMGDVEKAEGTKKPMESERERLL